MVAGVCGGLAEYFDVDPTLMRLVFVPLALLHGIGIIAYIILWIIAPKKGKGEGTREMESEIGERRGAGELPLWLGTLFILLGLVFLTHNLGLLWWQWGKFWPVVLILIGVVLLWRRR
jgi:phage shock protein C